MRNFLGLSKDIIKEKAPEGTWEFAKNIILNKKIGSISNEYGFEQLTGIPGKVIGIISTNEETVFFSKDNEYSCIGIKKSDNEQYIPIIRTIYYNFEEYLPIEGIYYYNHLKELIVVFSNGIREESFTPQLINLFNLGIELDNNKELINPNDINKFNLFPSVLEGIMNIEYGTQINTPMNAVYITYCYILPDNTTTTSYFPISGIGCSAFNFEEEQYKEIVVKLTNLDPSFNKVKIGILIKNEDTITGYATAPLPYSNGELIHTINTLNNYTEEDILAITLPTIFYKKVKTMTIQDNRLVIGNLMLSDDTKLQKYINMLNVSLYLDTDNDKNTYNLPNVLPGEVLALYIQPQYLSGEYGKAYPLIGPASRNANNFDVLTTTELTNLGIPDLVGNNYKRFHIENDGEFVLNTPFQNTEIHKKFHWGFWENEENYPNTDDFNSTVDYNNSGLPGDDLRNTPIKYFRLPSLRRITDKIPSILGFYEKLDDNVPMLNETTNLYGTIIKFGIKIDNFNNVIPAAIRSTIQGYRVLMVKRETGNRLVEDISFIKDAQEYLGNITGGGTTNQFSAALNMGGLFVIKDIHLGKASMFSQNLLINKDTMSNKLVEYNYGVVYKARNIISESDPAPGGASPDYECAKANRGLQPSISNSNDYTETINSAIIVKPINLTERFAILKQCSYLLENNLALGTFADVNHVKAEFKNTLKTNNLSTSDTWNPLLLPAFTTEYSDIKIWSAINKQYEIESLSRFYRREFLHNITVYNITKNIYTGFAPKELISLCKVNISDNVNKIHRIFGDVFTNNIYKSRFKSFQYSYIAYQQLYIRGNYSIYNNSAIMRYREAINYQLYYGGGSGWTWETLASQAFDLKIYNKESLRVFNDMDKPEVFNTDSKNTSVFPYRIARSSVIPKENIQTNSLREFKANDYYDMPNDKGEIIALRGTNKILYIQQKFSLFLASIKNTLNTVGEETYLAQGDLFDRTPEEVRYNSDKGYIGCINQFACIVIPDGYVVLDQIKGNIFIIGEGYEEISLALMKNYFKDNLKINKYQNTDNPFTQVGYTIGYDEEFNRLLITKKDYKFKYEEEVGSIYSYHNGFYYNIETGKQLIFQDELYFDNIGFTYSYSIANKKWICSHDYTPNMYYFNSLGLFSINNDVNDINNINYILYKHNQKLSHRGRFYQGKIYESYIDLIFNGNLDINKVYHNISWQSVVKGLNSTTLYNKTIDKIMIYNDYQCGGIINVDEFNGSRNKEGVWQFNDFRDVVIDTTLPIVDNFGNINMNNLNFKKSYFDKSKIFGIFVVVRLIMSNTNIEDIYINDVNLTFKPTKR